MPRLRVGRGSALGAAKQVAGFALAAVHAERELAPRDALVSRALTDILLAGVTHEPVAALRVGDVRVAVSAVALGQVPRDLLPRLLSFLPNDLEALALLKYLVDDNFGGARIQALLILHLLLRRLLPLSLLTRCFDVFNASDRRILGVLDHIKTVSRLLLLDGLVIFQFNVDLRTGKRFGLLKIKTEWTRLTCTSLPILGMQVTQTA